MRDLFPTSWGSPLVEFNPCHSLKDGRFSTRTAGRCAPDARWDGEMRQIPKFQRRDALQTYAEHRRAARKAHASLPRYLRLDAARAARDERAVVRLRPADGRSSQAHRPSRQVAARTYGTKSETLAVVRHEIGHITPLSLGRGGHVVAGVALNRKHPAQAKYLEEVRAWKNAIVAARGRVNLRRDVVPRLASYWAPVAESLLPRAPSITSLVAAAQKQLGLPVTAKSAGYGPGGAKGILMRDQQGLSVIVRTQQKTAATQRKAKVAELAARFEQQMVGLERYARLVRRAAARARQARVAR